MMLTKTVLALLLIHIRFSYISRVSTTWLVMLELPIHFDRDPFHFNNAKVLELE